MPASRFTQTGNYRVRYTQDQTIFATYAEQLSLLLLIAVLAVLPLIVPRAWFPYLTQIVIFSVAVIGLNVTTGYTGLINIGQGAFMVMNPPAGRTMYPLVSADHAAATPLCEDELDEREQFILPVAQP